MAGRRHNLTPRARKGRAALKRFMYSQMAIRSAIMIALGKEQPLVTFTVEQDPPSIYLVFELEPDRMDDLKAKAKLPAGIELAPVRCLEGDEPRYLMALNVYRVSGITNGRRAEWSVFVAEPDGTPRYMVLEPRASGRSLDPVRLFTKPSRVDHARHGDVIETAIGRDGEAFRSTVDLSNAEPAVNDREWVTANDRIYWGNGICDRTFYDAGLAHPAMVSVPPGDATVDDQSPWASFVDPAPVAITLFTKAIEFVVSPWENVGDLED